MQLFVDLVAFWVAHMNSLCQTNKIGKKYITFGAFLAEQIVLLGSKRDDCNFPWTVYLKMKFFSLAPIHIVICEKKHTNKGQAILYIQRNFYSENIQLFDYFAFDQTDEFN